MRRKITTLTGFKLALVCAGLLFIGTASAQITSQANGNWNAGSTWTGGVVPSSTDDVEINHTVTIQSATTVDRDAAMEITSGASLTVNGTINFVGTFGDGVYADGAGTFTVSLGATIATVDDGGLTASATGSGGGSVQTSTRNFNGGLNVIYNGTDPQLTGDGLGRINNLTIDNASGVSATANLVVTSNVFLTSGILDMDGFYLRMKLNGVFHPANDVTHYNIWYNNSGAQLAPDSNNIFPNPSSCNTYGGTPAANNGTFPISTTFIMGRVRCEFLGAQGSGVSNSYTIPFGFDNNTGAGPLYYPIRHDMRHGGGSADTNVYEFTVQARTSIPLGANLHSSATFVPNIVYTANEVSVPNPLGQQNVTIYWFTYFGLSAPGVALANITGLEWIANSTWWKAINGTHTKSGDICNGSILVNNNSQLREFYALGTGGSPVPVEMLSFTGEVVNADVLLKWSTAMEINSDYFIVEKSIDGINFNEIGRVAAAGNSDQILDYRMLDPKVEAGVIYYRLVQYDYDGASEVFGPIAVSTNGSIGNIITFPNPTVNTVSVTLPEMGSDAQLVILDINGKEMYNETIDSHRGTLQMDIDVSQLPHGIYYVRYGNLKEGYVNKMIQIL